MLNYIAGTLFLELSSWNLILGTVFLELAVLIRTSRNQPLLKMIGTPANSHSIGTPINRSTVSKIIRGAIELEGKVGET